MDNSEFHQVIGFVVGTVNGGFRQSSFRVQWTLEQMTVGEITASRTGNLVHYPGPLHTVAGNGHKLPHR